MRTLGIDFGERRIGLALSDPAGRLALPSRVLERTSDRAAIDALVAIVAEEGVESIVVGEPRRPADGAATAGARRARRFGEKLAAATGLPVEWVDETLTSQAADELLRQSGVPRARWRERRDAVAAQILLQEALDRRVGRGAGS